MLISQVDLPIREALNPELVRVEAGNPARAAGRLAGYKAALNISIIIANITRKKELVNNQVSPPTPSTHMAL